MKLTAALAVLGLLSSTGQSTEAVTTPTVTSNGFALARRHYDAALTLIQVGDRRGAIREFESAWSASARPNLLFNIAQQYRVLGEAGPIDALRRAVEYYGRYLAAQPEAPGRAGVLALMAELQARIDHADADADAAALDDEPAKTDETARPVIPAPSSGVETSSEPPFL